jgi:hypothetical protein
MTHQDKRILAFILGLCIVATGAILVNQESLFNRAIGACAILFGIGTIGISALTEER